ncbi:MAG: response regulator [Deltaproteobacteria bacterium]|nr:response regulator [Deltaproteobacteria bacterium]
MANTGESDSNLYSVRILRIYAELFKEKYPEININTVLEYAGLSRSELEDDGCWISQEQADRFHEISDRLTGNDNIAREAGRYSAESAALGSTKQYILGFMNPAMVYGMLERVGSKISKSTAVSVRKIAANKVEAVYEMYPGVKEKPYQCQNRIGTLESGAMFFTGEYATVSHPECIHEGAKRCRYVISWHEPPFKKAQRWRNYILSFGIITGIVSAFFLPVVSLIPLLLSLSTGLLALSCYTGFHERQYLARQIQHQGKVAEHLIAESDRRYNDSKLVQEIGHAIATILDIDELLGSVMGTLEKHLDYDYGGVMLANNDKTRLLYRAGYGYSPEQIEIFKNTALHLDRPGSRAASSVAFKNQMPYIVSDVEEVFEEIPKVSKDLLNALGMQSFVCVPIVYENKSLGVLALGNSHSSGPPQQSDLNLLAGIARQIAISINNVKMFDETQKSEEKYRVLVENANSIIMRLDTTGKITFVNRYAQDIYGYRDYEMLGENALGLIIPYSDSNKRKKSDLFSDFLNHPERYDNFENENIRRSGEKMWVSWSNKGIYDRDGNLEEVLCVGNDITERMKAAQDKKSLETQLQRSQKMEAIGMLAGGVAHDLNNILGGIVSYPEVLLMDVSPDNPMRKSLEIIKQSGEKAAAIVQDLLTLARRGVNTSNIINLNSTVRGYFGSPEYANLAEYHPLVRFDFKPDDGLLNMSGSGVHLSKTLMNLASNAAEAMPQGGTVTVTTRNQVVDSPIRGYDTIEKGEYVVLSVADSGTGISPEDVKMIFEPFYSKKVMGRSGTGLGMTVIWSTVKDHQGYIDVRTTLGEGTRVDLYFPVTSGEIEAQESQQPIVDYRGTEKILIVDDMLQQRDIAQQFLGKMGYRTDVADSGEAAIEYLKTRKADLLILDMVMDPGMDGLETYEKVLEIHSGQKAIIVSGFSESNRVKDALNLGVGAYVKKPYALHDMAKAVRAELDRETR